jgi:hypothetical protein
MSRLCRFAFLIVFLLVFSAHAATAGTYYIAANGSDSNDGTTKTTPWLHAPGMTGCTANCSSYTPAAGDNFILRGGDTWHTSTGSPVGLPWTWRWSGTSTSGIYVGVDVTWYSGSAFARPIFTMDNPLTTSSPANCSYDDSSVNGLTVSGSYTTIDNFEFTGKCWSGNPTGHYTVGLSGSNNTVTNSYVHGWSAAVSAGDDDHVMFSPMGSNNVFGFDVVDGADSTFGANCNLVSCLQQAITNQMASGWAFGGAGTTCYNIHHSVIRHVSNGIQCATINIVHDNLFEFTWNPSFGGRHGNTLETVDAPSGTVFYFYNNVVHNVDDTVQIWPEASTMYIFNNIMGDSYNSAFSPPDPNCLVLSPPGFNSGSGQITVFMYNNTFPSTCRVQAFGGNSSTASWASGSTITWENNHIIGNTAISGGLFMCESPSSCNVVDKGGEVFQTTANATSQGYTNSNDFAPTASSDSTVGAGLNATSSCGTFSADGSLCSGTSAGVLEVAGNGGLVASSPGTPINPRPSTGAWDAGAYFFGSSGSSPAPPTTKPNPPSGLTAIVQ